MCPGTNLYLTYNIDFFEVKSMSNGNIIAGIVSIILGFILIIAGVIILSISSKVQTEERSIEESVMNVPKELGYGLILAGIILLIVGFLIIAEII